MKRKLLFCTFFVIFTVLFFLGLGIAFAQVCKYAFADSEETSVEEQAETEETAPVIVEVEKDDDDLATVFKNNILPYIVSAGSAAIALLSVLMPYIKLRGQNKALQGMYTAAAKTIEVYKAKEGAITTENVVGEITAKLTNEIIPSLQAFITESVKLAVKENVTDTTGDITEIQASMEVLSAQLTNLIKAATLTWGEVDGVKELLAKSPTAQVLLDLYAEVKTLKDQIEQTNAEDIKPLDELIKELGAYKDEDE